MPVAGTPIVQRILEWLQRAGIRRVVLNLHHKPETITAIVGDGAHLGLSVKYSWEGTVLGSAGGPRRALPLLDAERFLIINGDTLTDCDLQAVVTQHDAGRARVTMAVVEGDVQRYGGVIVDAAERIRGFGKPGPDARAFHFIGVQAANADVFAHLRDDEPSETVKTLYPQLLRENPDAIAVYRSGADFFDVGTAADYLATVGTIAARENRPLDVGVHCRIAPDASIVNSVLWDRVTVGPGAHVVNSVLADDVVIPPGARIVDQVLV